MFSTMVLRSRFAKSRFILAGVCLLAVAMPVLRAVGQDTPQPSLPPVKTEPKEKEAKSAKLDALESTFDEKTSMVTAKDFKYTQDDMVVTGERGKYNKTTRRLLAEGNLVMDDPKHHITGSKADVDNRKKIAILTESVVITVKPSQDAAQNPNANVQAERKQGVVVHCDYAENHYKKKFLILRGHLVFTQKILKKDGTMLERTMTAEHAEYDGNTDKMLLFTPVKGHDSDGQTMDFEKDVLVGTREGEETMETKGRVNSSFAIPDDEDDSETKK